MKVSRLIKRRTFLFEDKLLHDIISKLSAKQKEILYLLYIEGIPEIEIAHKLAITKQAVNKTKNQTLKKIRKNYQQGES
ncbi:sigma factor-like helix-turn-helix DNA-binding protein [Metasolibacillus sp. FSL K6-0083]|uniref:sigma factor-like helix-turn-helix DNA-binding protein n=1 Tax=Metasolibacillus sp. FSL K6-0083 TaxID=2921416 RepID=UPI00315A641C